MIFTSYQFGLFVAVVFGAYYWPPLRRFQVQLLVLASLVFYGSGQLELLPLLLLAVLGTYLCLVRAFDNRAVWMPVGIAFNLALLAFFKYKFLFVAAATTHPSGLAPLDVLLRLPLPIGISFFVFHNISMLVDLTREKRPPPLRDVFLYIIFFPQLVSGPITRAGQFMPQIAPKRLSDVDVVAAAKWMLAGFFFKLYVANNLNEMTSYMDYPLYETVATPDRWLLVFLYSYQIYADFFGYSAIALGLALLFGYRLPVNFNLPYISASFSEFWTRWHISLSTWLRTYLYIPLGGNRKGPAKTCLNLMIVMTLGGLWHGAGLSYALWGLMHGLLLVIERPFLKVLGEAGPVIRATRMGVVFFCVTMLWIFFKLPDFDHALGYLSGMFVPTDNPNPTKLYRNMALLYALPVLIQHLGLGALAGGGLRRSEPYLYGALAALAWLEAGPESAFIYFQF
ncbi:MBOAT family protein [Bradyrhizobium diazoefficiens]|nr:MBOAT family O-acyltransferase [Bradyrhizobium diazoefficiens]MBR0967802.1 MBOAT family protein [Bradyrhizobium diazoefficiens]MBR0981196.1 MBOAT family protein [Bradyrhizobium diazoefficiens]MBR1010653.1 MBOAT family protein [Bradyrhizobium diazoefficiens]MBR1015660.1 MBOAT family protein [Bradyrhizobium diazoefficiens]MBR1054646.1 MBOAT family protein [Bradyrhizobium diazoefficiens]